MGIDTDPKCYERIEFVYMNSDKFQTKQDIAEFYKEKDMNGIEAEYREIQKPYTVMKHLKFLFQIWHTMPGI